MLSFQKKRKGGAKSNASPEALSFCGHKGGEQCENLVSYPLCNGKQEENELDGC
jgi:hypothetical protein